jgi:hypothetical protein
VKVALGFNSKSRTLNSSKKRVINCRQLTKEEARLLERHKAGKKERNPEFGGHKLDHWEKVLEESKAQERR